jgi:hypothetical protein
MAYSRGTGTAFNPLVKTPRVNPAKVGSAVLIPSTGGVMQVRVQVASKPKKNKAAK